MRRLVVVGVFVELALLIVGVTWIGALTKDEAPVEPAGAQAEDAAVDYRVEGTGSGAIVEVELVAQETTQTIADGVDYQVWTFDGTAPGPVIRVNVGDTVRFTLRNESRLGLAHSIDFHAAQTPWDVNYQPVQPGESFTFEWVARFPGVFMYHCGVPPVLHHIANGMYGAIVVEPEGLAPAREYVMVSSELYATDEAEEGVVVGDVDKMTAVTPSYVVFDGGSNRYLDAPLEARPNELIRLWVLNAGPTLTNAFHVIGALFDETHADGNPANTMYGLQTYNIAPGAGAMFELRIPDEGLYPFVTHSFAYTGLGAVGVIKVDAGVAAPPTDYPALADPFSGGTLPFEASADGGSSTDGAAPPGSEGTDHGHAGEEGVELDLMISGFSPNEIETTEGEVALTLNNLDPFPHDVTIDELDVRLLVDANASITASFTAPPGIYEFYCSIPGHREAGMVGTLTVLPGTGH
jgi:nitrite reductase (NO-forming)